MATVYRALDPRFKRDVAIKVLPPAYLSDAMFRARFEREAQVIAALEFPGIVPVYDFGEENGQPYLVMRYMPGGSLADRIRQGPLNLEEIVRIFNRLAPALDHFHSLGIVHRDLKPGNILFDQYDTAYISDFGIARLSEGTTSLTGDALIGTPAYMSPEQAQGSGELDGRSDIYALGAILYEALTGKQPYEATTPMGVILKHITEPVPRLHTVKSDLPEELELVIAKAMEKDRQRRYPTATALVADLNAILEKKAVNGKDGAMVGAKIESPEKPPITPLPAPDIPAAVKPPRQAPSAKPEIPTVVDQEPSEPEAKAQKLPVTPPFVLPESSQDVISKPAKARSLASAVGASKRKISPLWIVGGAILFGMLCVGIILGGWFLSAFLRPPTQESLVLQLTSTPTFPEAQPQQTAMLAQPTGLWQFSDNFSDPSSGWWSYSGEEGFMDYQSGSFQIRVDLPNWYLINSPGLVTKDSVIEVEAYKSSGPDENLFGVICRYQDGLNFYFFVIGSSGYYGIGKVLEGQPTLLSSEENSFSNAIHQGRTSNFLRADCIGNTLTFYVNNTKLATIQDSEFAEGEFGLFVGTFDIQGVTILFDNFKVTEHAQP